ncbi:MAG: prepilin-type N-terminal cleavage/methylation domain-containing protein [Candidatus Eremiobacteraeota bacterium]|nr:prepilin-type N-terminal cleavage/methylation domain-containing protein [Candidatus Eremiobacteraeota bacterium]
MSRSRAFTLIELLVAVALFVIFLGMAIPSTYASYARSRAARDAAARLAQDISLLERVAQDGDADEGATLFVTSLDPLAYAGYRGRPADASPSWRLGDVLFERTFPSVALSAAAVGPGSPLLFARDGSIQLKDGGGWMDQHQTLGLPLVAAGGGMAAGAMLSVNLFTGAVTTP